MRWRDLASGTVRQQDASQIEIFHKFHDKKRPHSIPVISRPPRRSHPPPASNGGDGRDRIRKYPEAQILATGVGRVLRIYKLKPPLTLGCPGTLLSAWTVASS